MRGGLRLLRHARCEHLNRRPVCRPRPARTRNYLPPHHKRPLGQEGLRRHPGHAGQPHGRGPGSGASGDATECTRALGQLAGCAPGGVAARPGAFVAPDCPEAHGRQLPHQKGRGVSSQHRQPPTETSGPTPVLKLLPRVTAPQPAAALARQAPCFPAKGRVVFAP